MLAWQASQTSVTWEVAASSVFLAVAASSVFLASVAWDAVVEVSTVSVPPKNPVAPCGVV